MKFLACLLLMIPAMAFSQTDNISSIPAGTSSIKIPGIGLHRVIRGFLDAGYPIERSGHTLKTIISGPKKLPHHNLFTILKVDINESGIVISGEYGADENEFTGIKATAQKNGAAWDSWKEMLVFADSFKKPVEFIIE